MEQAEVLRDKGKQLGDSTDEEHKVLFYQIEGFYAEVFYHKEHNVIKPLRSFKNVDQLRPYLERINVSL
jgi:abortive infection bacteriophage resistance protein